MAEAQRTPPIMTISELARILGVSRMTVQQWWRKRGLPGTTQQIGTIKVISFDPHQVREWLTQQEHIPVGLYRSALKRLDRWIEEHSRREPG